MCGPVPRRVTCGGPPSPSGPAPRLCVRWGADVVVLQSLACLWVRVGLGLLGSRRLAHPRQEIRGNARDWGFQGFMEVRSNRNGPLCPLFHVWVGMTCVRCVRVCVSLVWCIQYMYTSLSCLHWD